MLPQLTFFFTPTHTSHDHTSIAVSTDVDTTATRDVDPPSDYTHNTLTSSGGTFLSTMVSHGGVRRSPWHSMGTWRTREPLKLMNISHKRSPQMLIMCCVSRFVGEGRKEKKEKLRGI